MSWSTVLEGNDEYYQFCFMINIDKYMATCVISVRIRMVLCCFKFTNKSARTVHLENMTLRLRNVFIGMQRWHLLPEHLAGVSTRRSPVVHPEMQNEKCKAVEKKS